MNKYESLKAIYELKNAFIAILSHQFNSIKIDSNLLINYNVESLIDFLINNDFPIYSGYMVEQLINLNENKLLLIQEIKEDKLCVNSLNKINDKVFFSIKSAVDFIEMLYLELKPKLAKEIKRIESTNSISHSLDLVNPDDKNILITDEKKLDSDIYIFNTKHNKFIKYVNVRLINNNNKYFCYIEFDFNNLINFIIEKDV